MKQELIDKALSICIKQEKLNNSLSDIVKAGYEQVDSTRAGESGVQSWDGKWWVQKFGCDSMQSCMDECEAVLHPSFENSKRKMLGELADELGEALLPRDDVLDFIRNWKGKQ